MEAPSSIQLHSTTLGVPIWLPLTSPSAVVSIFPLALAAGLAEGETGPKKEKLATRDPSPTYIPRPSPAVRIVFLFNPFNLPDRPLAPTDRLLSAPIVSLSTGSS